MRRSFEEAATAYDRGDYETAFQLMRTLAKQGDAFAQFNLGVMYGQGRGVPQDKTEAMKWYRRAAERGDADAQFSLGTMYRFGRGVPQDGVQAYKWFSLAALRFSASEKEYRDMAVENRDGVAAKMTPAQIAEAKKLASEWRQK